MTDDSQPTELDSYELLKARVEAGQAAGILCGPCTSPVHCEIYGCIRQSNLFRNDRLSNLQWKDHG